MRVAIVHDWLYTLGGAERVLRELFGLYPDADLFCLFDNLPHADRAWIGYEASQTSVLQKLIWKGYGHRALLPLMPLAIEQLDVSKYDLVISSNYAVAKGVLTGPDQVHVSYIHSPMRYAWDLQEEYLGSRSVLGRVKSAFARVLLHRIRLWDSSSAHRPNVVVANSRFVARRIAKAWGRSAAVVHPPVDTQQKAAGTSRGDHFFTASRLVPYKNTRQIVEAFKLLPEQRLIVAGAGPEEVALRKIAGSNVSFLGYVSDAEMRQQMAAAQAFLFAACEDFGIIPVEAQAEGTPVLALGKGGARETVVTTGPNRTGLFFDEPTPSAIAATVNQFLAHRHGFTASACMAHAQNFAAARFRREMQRIIDTEVERVQADTPSQGTSSPHNTNTLPAVELRLAHTAHSQEGR